MRFKGFELSLKGLKRGFGILKVGLYKFTVGKLYNIFEASNRVPSSVCN